jgi:ankyrin repeat protein
MSSGPSDFVGLSSMFNTCTCCIAMAATSSTVSPSIVNTEQFIKSIDGDGSLGRAIMALPHPDDISTISYLISTEKTPFSDWCLRCVRAPPTSSKRALELLQRLFLIYGDIPIMPCSFQTTLYHYVASLPDRAPILEAFITQLKLRYDTLKSQIPPVDEKISAQYSLTRPYGIDSSRRGTVMHLAASNGLLDNIRVLVNAGVPFDEPTTSTVARVIPYSYRPPPPPSKSAAPKRAGPENRMISRRDVPTPMPTPHTPFHLAMLSGASHVVDWLIDHGVSLSSPTEGSGMITMLHVAARSSGLVHIIPLLMKTGEYDVNATIHSNGNTPLHEACLRGNVGAVVELIRYGAQVDVCNAHGDTALHLAADRNQSDVIESLSIHFASLSSSSSTATTATDTVPPMEVKVKSATDSTTTSSSSSDNNNSSIPSSGSAWMEVMDRRGATPLWRASSAGSNDVLRCLIRLKANVDHRATTDGHTCVMTAAINGCNESIELLSNLGHADLNAMDYSREKKSAMGHATRNMRLDTVAVLCELGAIVYVLLFTLFPSSLASHAHPVTCLFIADATTHINYNSDASVKLDSAILPQFGPDASTQVSSYPAAGPFIAKGLDRRWVNQLTRLIIDDMDSSQHYLLHVIWHIIIEYTRQTRESLIGAA